MPQAVTHFLIAVILLELYRDFFVKDRKSFPVHYVFIGGLAGLLPDLDIAVYYFLSFFGFSISEVHRTFSHTLFVPIIFVVLAFLFLNFKSERLGNRHLKLRNICLVIAFGIFIHLGLDAIIDGAIRPFYPFLKYTVGINLINSAPESWRSSLIPTLDAVLLILWMIYLQAKHRISDLF